MKMRAIGSSGIEASAIAFGAWAIGGWMWGGADEGDAVKALHEALDQGINFIDTAPIYGFGVSEEIVGKALKGKRDKVVLATKCGMVAGPKNGGVFKFRSTARGVSENGLLAIHQCNRPESIREEVELSLKRLQTDYIDLYQTHWQDSSTPIADTMGELMKLKEEGKIRAIGTCNATPDQLKEYAAAGQLDSDQEKYSMIDRKIEDGNLPWARENNAAVLAYSPLAMGLLTGKVTPDREFNEGDVRRGNPRFSVENREHVLAMLRAMQPYADAHNCTIAQLVIAWTIHQPGLTHALCGARNPKQVKENVVAGQVDLSAEDVAGIDKIVSDYGAKVV
jgi:aryl-alcohol dehydrogenase-like predicted oxidoreductase